MGFIDYIQEIFFYNPEKPLIFTRFYFWVFLGIVLFFYNGVYKNKNRSVCMEEICNHIWGENKNDRTLRSLIYRVRQLINFDLIQNTNGLGYKIV